MGGKGLNEENCRFEKNDFGWKHHVDRSQARWIHVALLDPRLVGQHNVQECFQTLPFFNKVSVDAAQTLALGLWVARFSRRCERYFRTRQGT